MKIPNKIKIGGHFVNVNKVDDMPKMNGNMGSSWNSYNSIRVNTNYPESQQAVTLLHELLHHILQNLGHASKEGIHTETNVEAISQALFQVLRDNKLDFREGKPKEVNVVNPEGCTDQ